MLRWRKKLLGMTTCVYTPLWRMPTAEITYEEAKATVLEALAG